MHEFADPTPDMPLELYKDLVDRTEDYIRQVQPIGYGEPLLWPHIVEAVKYARDKNKRVTIYTNGNALTPEMSYSLMKAGLTDIAFSIEADNKELFEFLRRPLKWEKVHNNIREFFRLREENEFTTKAKITGCTTPENKGQGPRIVKFWKDLGADKAMFRTEKMHPRPSDLETPYTYFMPKDKKKHPHRIWMRHPNRCKQLNQHLTVDWNGDVLPCCKDVYGTYVIGNVTDNDPLEVFNNDIKQDLRRKLETGIKYPTLCAVYCMKKADRSAWGEKKYHMHELVNNLVRTHNEAHLNSLG